MVKLKHPLCRRFLPDKLRFRWWLCCLAVLLSGCAAYSPPSPGIAFAGADSPLRAYLYPPAGNTPYPVVIDLHGCNGIWPARNKQWLPKLNDAGFAVLQVDSFSGRGTENICGDLLSISPMMRTLDAAAAMRWVMGDPRFATDGMFLMGMSHGATTALLTQLQPSSVFSQLKGVIAFYPYCYDSLPVLSSDLLVLIGEQDDWTPASRCRDMRIGDRAGHRYELVVYPGAYHSFDVPAPTMTYYGHLIGYNEAAAQDSIDRVLRFLRVRNRR